MPRRALRALVAAVVAATPLFGSDIAPSTKDVVASSADSTTPTVWTAAPAHRARAAVHQRQDPRTLRVTTRSAGRAVLHRVRPVRTDAPRGTRHLVGIGLRSDRDGHRVRLVVRERNGATVLQRKQRTVRLGAGRWTRLTVPLRIHRPGSRLAVRVVSPEHRPGDELLVRRPAVKTPTPPPAPEQRPAPEHRPAPAPDPDPGAADEQCAVTSRGIPGCGTYLGAAYGSNTDPSSWERELGAKLSLRRTYFRGDQVEGAVRHARTDLAEGRLPWISFKLPHSWEQMATGAGDAWARDLARRLGELDGPVWVAFHHEPEGDGDIGAWRRMQERLGPLVRAGGDNIAFTVVLTGWHQFYGDAEFSLDNMWPRGIKVDVAGFDVYNSLGVVKDGKENTKGTDLRASYFTKIKAWADAEGVAWGLAETGYTDKAAAQDPAWIQRTYGEMAAMGGVAFTYFNTTLNSIAPWRISAGTKQADFAKALKGTVRLPR